MEDKWYWGWLYHKPGVRHNVLIYPFLWVTFILGLSYSLLRNTEAVKDSVLYQNTEDLGEYGALIWGIIAVAVVVVNAINMLKRSEALGHIVTAAGMGIWLFALILFVVTNHWLQAAFIALPNFYFWGWWNRYVTNYHLREKSAAYN